MKNFFKFNTANTDRRYRILIIDAETLRNQGINIEDTIIKTIRFENLPDDVHIVGYRLIYDTLQYHFLVEHNSFYKIPVGCEIEKVTSKISDCLRLIKLSKNL